VSEGLSESAEKHLGRVVASRGEHSSGEGPDRILWEEAKLDYEAYVEAAKQLVANKLAESYTSDFASLHATPEGMKRARGV
jgi:predicted Zn-dependent protease with MMP-like domain